ncbi:MAG TPA: gluconate 2-dehydrogenase subunit 3 family protein [Opitutaceae bacterium]
MNSTLPERMDRRLAIKWMLAAGAGAMLSGPLSFGAPGEGPPMAPGAKGYGTDPNLVKPYKLGDYWPLTFTDAQRRTAAALCDVILPAEGDVPAASGVAVQDFIDEWVSAPYPGNVADRKVILDGMAWMEAESVTRFGKAFTEASDAERLALCEAMAPEAEKGSPLEAPSRFFKRFRNLTSAGFFTTPIGMKDLGYVGNIPLATFDGPPADLVAKLGLTDEVKW